MLVKLFVPIMQMDVMSVRSVVLVNWSNHQLLVKLSLSLMSVIFVNISSISQLVKTINVTKSVCSSNAINSVICNSTCKPVSNFVSDCQSVKLVRKLSDANQKHTHEQLIMNNLKLDLPFHENPVSVTSLCCLLMGYF